MPFLTDVGASCGKNFVNAGSAGNLDGVTIVGGHEYAVVGVDKAKGEVTVFNPWNDPNAVDTPPYVTLSQAQFQASFSNIDANPTN